MPNMKKLAREAANRVLSRVGLEIRSFRPDTDFQIDDQLRSLRVSRQAEKIHAALSDSWLAWDQENIFRAVADFDQLMRAPPFRQTMGGAGYVNGLLLFTTTRRLSPDYIVESGVFRGFSTWVLRNAAPKAEIHSFDIDFSHLDFKDSRTRYYNHDWSQAKLDIPDTALGFFDDHVNQARRINECSERGLTTLVFDDDISLTAAYADIPLIIPTVSMILDDKLGQFDEIAWRVGERRFKASLDHQEVSAARSRIAEATHLPSLEAETMFHNSPYTAVRLHA